MSEDWYAFVRRRLVRHNWQVAGFSTFTLVAATLLWAALYFVASWITLFFATVIEAENAAMPARFNRYFLLVAAGLLFLAWVDQALTRNELPKDKKGVGEIAMDFILAIPRSTLAIWGNLRAWQRLDEAEIRAAARLAEQLGGMERMAMQSTPLEIPDEKSRGRVILALMLTEIIHLRHEDGEVYLRLVSRGVRRDYLHASRGEPGSRSGPPPD